MRSGSPSRAGPPSLGRTALAAVALALSLLSKAEVGAAAAAVILVAGFRSADSGRRAPADGATLLAAVLLAAAGYAFAFRGIPLASLASEGPLVLFSPPPEWRQVYRLISGLDDPAAALSRIATAVFLDALILGGAWIVSRAAGSGETKPGLAETVWWVLLAAAVVFCATPLGGSIEDRLPALFSPAPLAAALAALWILRSPLDERARARFLALRVLCPRGRADRGQRRLRLRDDAVRDPRAARPRGVGRGSASRRSRAEAGAAPGLSPGGGGGPARARGGRARSPRAHPAGGRFAAVETAAGALRLPEPWARASELALGFLAERAQAGRHARLFSRVRVLQLRHRASQPAAPGADPPGTSRRGAEAEVAARIRDAGPRFIVLVDQTPPGWAAARFGVDYARGIAARDRSSATFSRASRARPRASRSSACSRNGPDRIQT